MWLKHENLMGSTVGLDSVNIEKSIFSKLQIPEARFHSPDSTLTTRTVPSQKGVRVQPVQLVVTASLSRASSIKAICKVIADHSLKEMYKCWYLLRER